MSVPYLQLFRATFLVLCALALGVTASKPCLVEYFKQKISSHKKDSIHKGKLKLIAKKARRYVDPLKDLLAGISTELVELDSAARSVPYYSLAAFSHAITTESSGCDPPTHA